MTSDASHGSLDLSSLRSAYASGQLSPEALIESVYARMERDDLPGVWIHRISKEEALARARQLGGYRTDLPLYGVPFAVKDNIDVAGMPTTAACPAYAYVPEKSAVSVEALASAGALCLGKVNLDQFATGLVGTRSPYGACRNVFDPAYLSGGSSSGSAVAVAAHHVSFALGTDTAGSGRVPAALNNLVGLKPTRGLVSTEGVVPACASLDCVSVFALSVPDAVRVRELMLGRAPAPLATLPRAFRFAVPEPLEFFGDGASEASFAESVALLTSLGGTAVRVDYAPFAELGDMLYGPWVVERYIALREFLERKADSVLPITREIILSAHKYSAADVLTALRRVEQLKRTCLQALEPVDFMVTPTVPRLFRIEDDAREPRAVNDKLGIYTRFVNFIGCPVLSIPQAFRADGLPSGISLVGLPERDTSLDAIAAALHERSGAGMGRLRHEVVRVEPVQSHGTPREARLAVVGAHMRGLALNAQLSEVGARYVRTARTAESYRLFALPNSEPERPGMLQVAVHGAAIEVELWDLSWHALGELMARVPPPLAIGSVRIDSGELVKGFLCEACATEGARDITEFGGYRAYLGRRAP